MPALDYCHQKVVNALGKDGWSIRPKPFTLFSPLNNLFVDIEAYRINDDDLQEIIIVEVKCFPDARPDIHELYVAIGQYLVYRELMDRMGIPYPLYLAMPTTAYNDIFEPIAVSIVNRNTIKLILVDLENEVIERWIE